MAQAVFEEHPLEEYLREAGDSELMPGSLFSFTRELESGGEGQGQLEWVIEVVGSGVERLHYLLSDLPSQLSQLSKLSPWPRTSPFVERFKYDVISSSLLASTLPSTTSSFPSMSSAPSSHSTLAARYTPSFSSLRSHRRSFSPDFPGKLDLDSELPAPAPTLTHSPVHAPAHNEPITHRPLKSKLKRLSSDSKVPRFHEETQAPEFLSSRQEHSQSSPPSEEHESHSTPETHEHPVTSQPQPTKDLHHNPLKRFQNIHEDLLLTLSFLLLTLSLATKYYTSGLLVFSTNVYMIYGDKLTSYTRNRTRLAQLHDHIREYQDNYFLVFTSLLISSFIATGYYFLAICAVGAYVHMLSDKDHNEEYLLTVAFTPVGILLGGQYYLLLVSAVGAGVYVTYRTKENKHWATDTLSSLKNQSFPDVQGLYNTHRDNCILALSSILIATFIATHYYFLAICAVGAYVHAINGNDHNVEYLLTLAVAPLGIFLGGGYSLLAVCAVGAGVIVAYRLQEDERWAADIWASLKEMSAPDVAGILSVNRAGYLLVLAVSLFAFFVATGYYFLAVCVVGAGVYMFDVNADGDDKREDYLLTLSFLPLSMFLGTTYSLLALLGVACGVWMVYGDGATMIKDFYANRVGPTISTQKSKDREGYVLALAFALFSFFFATGYYFLAVCVVGAGVHMYDGNADEKEHREDYLLMLAFAPVGIHLGAHYYLLLVCVAGVAMWRVLGDGNDFSIGVPPILDMLKNATTAPSSPNLNSQPQSGDVSEPLAQPEHQESEPPMNIHHNEAPNYHEDYLLVLGFALFSIFLATGYYLLCLSFLGVVAFVVKTDVLSSLGKWVNGDGESVQGNGNVNAERKRIDQTPTLEVLTDLIASNDIWESTVQEALAMLAEDERNTYLPSSPTSSLRIALNSSLHTTQTQCDNVRTLLTALTSPSELAQLSEMYAPPSPPTTPETRPLSLPNSMLPHASSSTDLRDSYSARPHSMRRRTSSVPLPFDKGNKRATWNGSYAALANVGSPSAGFSSMPMKRKEKRRSDLSSLLNVGGSGSSFQIGDSNTLLQVKEDKRSSVSAPVSPLGPGSELGGELGGVSEEVEEGLDQFASESTKTGGQGDEYAEEHFGAAALNLRRKRRTGGLEAFGFAPHTPHSDISFQAGETTPLTSSFARPPRSPRTPITPVSPRSPRSAHNQQHSVNSPRTRAFPPTTNSSRYTAHRPPRHPLSLSSLQNALNVALAAKRYACAHLLALRFAEEEGDESYWEDVRSVMGLLVGTFGDASAHLGLVVDEEGAMRHERVGSLQLSSDGDELRVKGAGGRAKARTMEQMVSFAPLPSHLSRFAAHVDAIGSALNDAREQLEECVQSLRDEPSGSTPSRSGFSPDRSRQRRRSQLPQHGEEAPDDQHAALAAYERLRRELGLALRECERGRERLLDIVSPPAPLNDDLDDNDDDLPALGHDASDDSDKPDSTSSPMEDDITLAQNSSITVVGNGNGMADPAVVDDATSHLLLTSSSLHLPPPGIEQVFEGDSGTGGIFTRERSKLSREERILMAKKARESGRGLGLVFDDSSSQPEEDDRPKRERWGPGGEVVQELKDVIWKVGERRRKMASDGQSHNVDLEHLPLTAVQLPGF